MLNVLISSKSGFSVKDVIYKEKDYKCVLLELEGEDITIEKIESRPSDVKVSKMRQ